VKIAFNPRQYPFNVYRSWVVQPLFGILFFLGPVLNLFRVDMIHQHLVFLGHPYPFELQYLKWLPIVFYGSALSIAVITAFFGRLFCGWACPHNILTEATRVIRGILGIEAIPVFYKRWQQRFALLAHPGMKLVAALGSILLMYGMTFLLFTYVVPLDWLLGQYLAGSPHPALIMGQLLFTTIGLFLLMSGHLFCKTCCPYGLAQSISAYHSQKRRPMEIKFTGTIEENCKTCTGCQQVCPVAIDPRGPLKVGQFLGCWNCGECIDACKQVHAHKGTPPLLSFSR